MKSADETTSTDAIATEAPAKTHRDWIVDVAANCGAVLAFFANGEIEAAAAEAQELVEYIEGFLEDDDPHEGDGYPYGYSYEEGG